MDVVKLATEMAQKHAAALDAIIVKLDAVPGAKDAAAELRKEATNFRGQIDMMKKLSSK